MRLSKLARELSKTPSELIDFFEKRGLKHYDGANSKIADEHVELTYKNYRPDFLEITTKTEIADELSSSELEEVSEIKEPDANINEPGSEIPRDKMGKDLSSDTDPGLKKSEVISEITDEVEVIRAPKIKLEGVKVIGKIDLPEFVKPSKKEESIDKKIARKVLFSHPSDKSESTKNRRKPESERRVKSQQIRHKQEKPQLSYEEKLRRDEEKRKRSLERKLKNLKEQKKKHYLKNVQSKVQATNRNKSKRKAESEYGIRKEKPVYKNPIRRFIAWLNCEYDQYD